MANLFGKVFTKQEILEKVGDLSQVCEAKWVSFRGGNREGTEGVSVKTGSGLNFYVLPGRGMAIGAADY